MNYNQHYCTFECERKNPYKIENYAGDEVEKKDDDEVKTISARKKKKHATTHQAVIRAVK